MISITNLKIYTMAILAVIAGSAIAIDEPAKSNPASVIINGIPKSVEPIVGKNADYSYLVRVNGVHNLGRQLSGVETEAVYKFLEERYTAAWGFMTLMEFNGIKNEAVIALSRQQTDLSPVLSDMMMDMYSDKSYDEMWRNYCVQFMGQLYPRMDEQRRDRCVKLLWPAAAETATCIPGAALIALGFIADTDSQAVDKSILAKTAYDILSSPEALEINKTTALQTCSQLKYTQALPIARSIVSAKKAPVSLKISAIAAIGQLGNASDKALLEPLTTSSDTRLTTAATAALKRLSAK